MKKQLIILLTAVSLLVLAQSPQRFPGGVIGKYFQKSGSSSDSVLLGNGQAKALSTIQANVDTVHKIATKYDVSKKLDITGNGSQLTGLAKTQVGLSNVDNTSDANKPISAATQTALNGKQPAGTYIVPADTVKSYNYNTAIFQPKGSYLTGNQNITLSGDVTGSGTTAITATLANSGVTAGTYNNSATSVTPVTVDSKGRITGTGTAVTITPAWGSVTGKPTIVSTEVDPTVSAWAKAATKPSYTYSEVGAQPAGTYIIPSDTLVFVRKSGTQTITGQKTFSGGLIANGIESSAGGLFYGQTSPFPTGLGTYVANYVSPTYGARSLAYNGTAYQDYFLGKLISGTTFQLALKADGTSVFGGTVSGTNLSGTNTGDETLSSIKSKLGAVTSSSDGYLTYAKYNEFSAKQNALGFTPENIANKGTANGYVPLGSDSKIATTYLPDAILGSVKYKGSLNASGNSYPSSPSKGDYYVISTPGTIGSVAYTNGDWAVYNGTTWDAILQGHYVTSVFGRTGAITANAGDYNTSQITESGNLYYTDARAQAANASALSNKVDKVFGKGLSTIDFTDASYVHTDNNYTTTEKNKLVGIASGATVYTDAMAQSAISLTTNNNSGPATKTGGAINIPNYTLSGLGGVSSAALSTTTVGLTATSSTSGGVSSLTVNAASGYSIPTIIQLNNAATAYSWGNHATAGYALATGTNASGMWPISINGTAANSLYAANGSIASVFLNGNWQGVGYWGIGSHPTNAHTIVIDQVGGVYSGQSISNVAVASDVNLKLGSNTVLHSGNFSFYATPLNGSGATGTWPISISGTAANTTNWGGNTYTNVASNDIQDYIIGYSSNGDYRPTTNTAVKSWLGLGSYAYRSSGLAEFSSLSTVALSGSYSDLNNKPTLNTFLPSQSGQTGKVLTTDGSSASWQSQSSQYIQTSSFNLFGLGCPSISNLDLNSYAHEYINGIFYCNYPTYQTSSDIVITLPSVQRDGWTLSDYWKDGQCITFCRAGATSVTFVPATTNPVPIRSINGYTKIADNYTMVSVVLHYDENNNPFFYLIGNLGN